MKILYRSIKILLLFILILLQQALPAQTGKSFLIPLWPAGSPVLTGPEMTEKIIIRSKDPQFKNRSTSQVSRPAIEVYLPDSSCGAAILICPGGSYAYQAYDKEGTDIAIWLNQLGITACILKYRLPAEGHTNGKVVPLQDAQRALRIIRSQAAELNTDPGKIGVMGFSAGGHLASTLGTAYHREVYEKYDPVDQLSARPDFIVLVYPVISMQDGVTHGRSRENLLGSDPPQELRDLYSSDLQVTDDTPPAFLVHASDDGAVPPENSLRFYRALLEQGVPAEMHLFVEGGHGFGIRDLRGSVAEWTECLEKWIGTRPEACSNE